MGSVKERTYGGRTAAQRSGARRGLLVEAAFELVASDGWRALRVDTVCRAAGLNKRYFYESFAGLDELTGAVMQQLAEETIAVTLAAIDGSPDPDAATTRAVEALVTHVTHDPRRARVLFGAVPPAEAAAVHRTTAIRRVIAAAAEQGRSLHALTDDAVLGAAAAMLVGGTSQVVLDWLDGGIPASRERLVADLIAFWEAIAAAAVRRAA